MWIYSRFIGWAHECRVKLWLAAHPVELSAILKSLESGATAASSVEAGGIASTILSVVSAIHADLKNPAFEGFVGDVTTLARQIESGGVTYAAICTAANAALPAIDLIESVLNQPSPPAAASTTATAASGTTAAGASSSAAPATKAA